MSKPFNNGTFWNIDILWVTENGEKPIGTLSSQKFPTLVLNDGKFVIWLNDLHVACGL
jgi:hypothetical protein